MSYQVAFDVGLYPLATYRRSDFARIAAAIGVQPADVQRHQEAFDHARIFVQYSGDALPQSPTQTRTELLAAAANARRLRAHLEEITSKLPAANKATIKPALNAVESLLCKLGIEHWSKAIDGPHPDKLDALTYAGLASYELVLAIVSRIGELPSILEELFAIQLPEARLSAFSEIIEAIEEFERIAGEAADKALFIGDLVVPKGHVGDWGVTGWVEDMAQLYEKITGLQPTAWVNKASPSPFIRMLIAAGRPIGVVYSVSAWRSRVRAYLMRHPRVPPLK